MRKKLVFLTGAGISQPSGIPTFRGETGMWNNHRIEDVATMSAFIRDPKTVIDFMNGICHDLKDKSPNKAHYAIAELEKEYDVIVITQNIDTLHEQAGSTNVIHLHGKHDEIVCRNCGIIHKNENPIIYGEYSCSSCNSKDVKHNIILFQEMLNISDFNYAYDETYDSDLFIQIGTSSLVSPACDLVKHAKPERKRVEMNLTRSRPKAKDRFVFRHYYLGNIIDTIDHFIADLPKLLPVCRRVEWEKELKDKDRYKNKPIILVK